MKLIIWVLILFSVSSCLIDRKNAKIKPALHNYSREYWINLLLDSDEYFVEMKFYDKDLVLRGYLDIDYRTDKVLLSPRFISVGGPSYQKIKIVWEKDKLPKDWKNNIYWVEEESGDQNGDWIMYERKLTIKTKPIESLSVLSKRQKVELQSYNGSITNIIAPVYPPDRSVLNDGTLYYNVQCESGSGERCCTETELNNQITDIHKYYQENSVKFRYLKQNTTMVAPLDLFNKDKYQKTRWYSQSCDGENKYSLALWGLCKTVIVHLNVGPHACEIHKY